MKDLPLAEARALLAEHPAVDLHVDTLQHALCGVDLASSRVPHASPARLAEGGFGGAVYAMWPPPHLGAERAHVRVTDMLAALRRLVDGEWGRRLRLLPGLEDARVLEVHPQLIDALAAAGGTYVTLTWNTGNRWATSCYDSRSEGLTDAGRTLVAKLDAAGLRADVSHLSDRAARDTLAAAERSPIASHSGARAVCPHPRNVSDDLARAIAERGGVIGVNVYPVFLDLFLARGTLDAVVRHVEHLWHVAGEEAVAFGSDFDGITRVPADLSGSDGFPALVATLLSRGHAPARVARFAGGNARRVFPAFG